MQNLSQTSQPAGDSAVVTNLRLQVANMSAQLTEMWDDMQQVIVWELNRYSTTYMFDPAFVVKAFILVHWRLEVHPSLCGGFISAVWSSIVSKSNRDIKCQPLTN